MSLLCLFMFFFFKQKTAYEMRISDWSSDVCSSDLCAGVPHADALDGAGHAMLQAHVDGGGVGGRHAVGHAQLGAADGDVLELAAVGLPVDDQGDVLLARHDEAQRTAALEVSQVLRSNLGSPGISSSGYRAEEHTS